MKNKIMKIRVVWHKPLELIEHNACGLSIEEAFKMEKDLLNEGYVTNIYGLPVKFSAPIKIKNDKDFGLTCSDCGMKDLKFVIHSEVECLQEQIRILKKDNAMIKKSVSSYSDTIHSYRQIVGKLLCATIKYK